MTDFLTLIWDALRGRLGGIDFIEVYAILGGIIWLFLLFKVFLTEGLSVAMGNKTEMPKILIKYVFVAGMFFVWPMAADAIFGAISALADMIFPDMATVLNTMSAGMNRWAEYERADWSISGIVSTLVGTVQNFVAGSILIIIGGLVLFLCYMLIIIMMVGSLTVLMLNLVLGPVFFALAFDRDFRSIAIQWFTAVLSYFMVIPLYGAAFTVAVTIAGAAIPAEWVGLASTGTVYAQLLGPFIAVGIVFSVNKVVNAFVGGAAGAGLASAVLGASLIPASAMMRASSSAIVQAIQTASKGMGGGGSGAGPTPTSSVPSQTVKSALGGNP